MPIGPGSRVSGASLGDPRDPDRPRPERWWLHLLLFGVTFLTTTLVGVQHAISSFQLPVPQFANAPPETFLAALALQARIDLWLLSQAVWGLTYSLPVLTIFLAHEMGHYLMCRRYRIDASPPYFLPFPHYGWPVTFGTMGAFIRIREPFRGKKQVFDVGVAGPVAGFLATLPFLAYGVLHTPVKASLMAPQVETQVFVFHYPLLVSVFQKLLLGHTLTSHQVLEHPTFMAAWAGLFLTAFNLVPLGQLDGGHVLYSVFGRRTRLIAAPVFLLLVGGAFYFSAWHFLVLASLVLVFGLRHPPVPDEDEPLDFRRKAVAAFALIMFVVSFVPLPFSEVWVSPPRRAPVEGGGTVVHQLDLHRGAKAAG